MKNTTLLKVGIYGGLIFSFIVLIYFLIALYSHDITPVCLINDNRAIDGQITGQIGDFIGGVVGTFLALASIFLLILTLVEQRRENRKDSFEQTLSSMIDRYNSITSEIKYRNRNGATITGKEAIADFLESYIYILKNVLDYVDEELAKDSELKKKYDQESAKRFALKLAYGYFMYGYKNYFVTKVKTKADYTLNLNVTASLTRLADKDSAFWSKARSTQLGHYFRCIFYIVKFVATQSWLSEDEKYKYVKQLRSLMSDKEQILLYYNALSVLGEPWIKPLGETKVEEMCYMARFRMIKNIPYYYEYVGINPKTLFITEYNAYNQMGKKFFEIDLKEQKSYSFIAFSAKSK